MESGLWNETAIMPSANLDAILPAISTSTLLGMETIGNVRVGLDGSEGESTGMLRPENSTKLPCISSGTTTTTTRAPVACAGYVASTAENVGNFTYHQADTHSHAIIYIGVILALYFSALTVLIVRYVTKERQCYVGHRTLKKSRSDRRTRERFLGYSNRQMEPRKLQQLGGSNSAGAREPQPLQLIVPMPSTSAVMTSTALVHMDTAV